MGLDPNTLVTAGLGAGGVAFVGAIINAWRSIRNGARVRDRDTVGSLREQRDESDARTREALADRDYLHDIAGRLIFQLRTAGLVPDLPEGGLVLPSARANTSASPPVSTRRGRGRTAA